jgi:hypothetical protein
MALTQVSSGLLQNTGVTSGVYGGATAIPVITINAEGQITSASNTSITAGISQAKVTAISTILGF